VTDLFRSPRLYDGIVLAVIVEAVALVAYRRRTGRGVPVPAVASFLGAGIAFVLALRLSASGAPRDGSAATAFAGVMLVALALHFWHLRTLWHR
jgi:hypothetical protein